MAARKKVARARAEAAAEIPIRIAKNLDLDRKAATQKFGVIGRSESGKTYLVGKLIEGLHEIGGQVIVLDLIGNWWGLTLAANGVDPGLPFVVFGLVSMVNPGYMAGFFTDQRLIIAGLGGLCWMGIGVFIMAKMINFEI